MKSQLMILHFVLFCALSGCAKQDNTPNTTPTTPSTSVIDTSFAKGADISWVTEQEASGVKFYNQDGTQADILTVLKNKGINAIRLRVWVNPSPSWNAAADVVAKAKRVKAAGMRLLIDFHYSDTWADPANQTKPVAWKPLDFPNLKAALYSHTVDVMTQLKTANCSPEWVQIGNETNDGMLWPDGKASTNMANFASLISAGYDAVKSVSATSQVIVHISNGYDASLFKWMFMGLTSNNAKFDIIGMSLYPTASDWSTKNQQTLTNMTSLIATFNKKVMVVEVGMPANDAVNCKSFLSDIITKTKGVANGKGLGVFYWEPQSYKSWKGYGLGAFEDTGKPSVAMDAFLN